MIKYTKFNMKYSRLNEYFVTNTHSSPCDKVNNVHEINRYDILR